MEPGLYLIPTPVGNLEDISLRALRYLKEVDFLLAEDTRSSGILLKHFAIVRNLFPYHMHNEHKATHNWIEKMKSGASVGLISDAGTPGISDPGFLLVRESVTAGITVSCLPGATALIPALVISGFPCEKFVFEGFLPPKKGRQKRWKNLENEVRTVIFYESPHRIHTLLKEIMQYRSEDEEVVIVREISKKFETAERGTAKALLNRHEHIPFKGELVLILGPRSSEG